MTTTSNLTQYVPDLALSRLGPEAEAGLWITSLPWPRAAAPALSLNGATTYTKPLGQWPDVDSPAPRRLLMIADGGNSAPATLALTDAPAPTSAPPAASMSLLQRSTDPIFMWENHLLKIEWGGKIVELALGLRTGETIHWWEACNMVTLEETPACRTVEMGGAIPLVRMTSDTLKENPGFSNPFLHKHTWLNGHLYLRLHANGVCEVFAHHINSKFYDDGLELKDAVPVIGIRTSASADELDVLAGPWDGSQPDLTVGGVRFDLNEAARFASPEQPGSLGEQDGLLVWQPYQGVEVFGGDATLELTGDAFISHAEDHVIPRGVARTVRFSLSLSDRSPRVARYLAPAWWYGLCEEFVPAPLLPVSNDYDKRFDAALDWARNALIRGGFEDGALPLHNRSVDKDGNEHRHENGLKGDLPYAMLMTAWRNGNADDFDNAIRAAYHFTDIGVDHAMKMVRMQGFPPLTFTPTLNRMQASIMAYLETGDPYLLDTAQAVVDNTWWTHKNSWPRMAVGRDACFITGALLLWRYFADEHYRRIAYGACKAVVAAQRENGSFGDQGGGAGLHGWGAYITKPWMGLLATAGLVDYLELFPEEPELLATVIKFGDWLMSQRYDQGEAFGWSYQHDYDGGTNYYEMYSGKWMTLPTPGQWHQDNLARLLGYCTLRSGDPAYLDAWAHSYESSKLSGDYSIYSSLIGIPWIQAQLWKATPADSGGIKIQPLHFGERTPLAATIITPQGPVVVGWTAEGELIAPEQVVVA